MNEKYFKTEVVASLVEVCYLGGFDYNEIFELASFILNEDVNMSNLYKYRADIMYELNKMYPDLNRNIMLHNGDIISEDIIDSFKESYKRLYGDYMLIKSKSLDDTKYKSLSLKNKNTII